MLNVPFRLRWLDGSIRPAEASPSGHRSTISCRQETVVSPVCIFTDSHSNSKTPFYFSHPVCYEGSSVGGYLLDAVSPSSFFETFLAEWEILICYTFLSCLISFQIFSSPERVVQPADGICFHAPWMTNFPEIYWLVHQDFALSSKLQRVPNFSQINFNWSEYSFDNNGRLFKLIYFKQHLCRERKQRTDF